MRRFFVRRVALAAAFAVLTMRSASALPTIRTTEAHSMRGNIVWHVILCDFGKHASDTKRLAKKYHVKVHETKAYYRSLFFTPGTHGLEDYVKSVSYGAANVTGDVHGWYHEPKTYAQEHVAPNGNRYGDCIAAAKAAGYVAPEQDRIYIITAPGIDVQGREGAGAIGGDWTIKLHKDGSFDRIGAITPLPEIAHEFGHGIGLGHSFSNDLTWIPFGQGANAEYDNQFDLMSSAHIFADPTGAFGGGPPFFTAHHLDEMGWLPMSRIVDIGEDGVNSRTIKLAALTHPEAPGYLLARVLYDPSDRFHYYTVEFREADGWDSGWEKKTVKANALYVTYPHEMIMIDEIQKNKIGRTDPATGAFIKPPIPYQGGSYYTSLQRELGPYAGSGNGAPVQSLSDHGVTISVVNISGHTATVKVTTKFQPNPGWTEFGPLTCADGYVWRAADDLDYVCVTPADRQAAADENTDGPKHRHSANCDVAYVPRAAFPGDTVCVTLAQEAIVLLDNAQASLRIMNQTASLSPKESFLALD